MAVNKKLAKELQEAKESLKAKDMHPSKSIKKIKQLETRLEDLEKVNELLHNRIFELEKENSELVNAEGMVSKEEYKGLIKQLETEKKLREQFQKLFDIEKEKHKADKEKAIDEINKLKGTIEADKKHKAVKNSTGEDVERKHSLTIKELESKLSRKGIKWEREEGKTEADVIRLRSEGKSLRDIRKDTGMSTTTIMKILKSNKSDN